MFKAIFKWTFLLVFGVVALVAILSRAMSLAGKWRDRENFSVVHQEIISGARVIHSYRQAAEFALSSGSLKREFEKCDKVKPGDSWTVSTELVNDVWIVRAKWNPHIVFGYQCSFAFDKLGKTIEAPLCSYYATK